MPLLQLIEIVSKGECPAVVVAKPETPATWANRSDRDDQQTAGKVIGASQKQQLLAVLVPAAADPPTCLIATDLLQGGLSRPTSRASQAWTLRTGMSEAQCALIWRPTHPAICS